jgi:hypothetical protein
MIDYSAELAASWYAGAKRALPIRGDTIAKKNLPIVGADGRTGPQHPNAVGVGHARELTGTTHDPSTVNPAPTWSPLPADPTAPPTSAACAVLVALRSVISLACAVLVALRSVISAACAVLVALRSVISTACAAALRSVISTACAALVALRSVISAACALLVALPLVGSNAGATLTERRRGALDSFVGDATPLQLGSIVFRGRRRRCASARGRGDDKCKRREQCNLFFQHDFLLGHEPVDRFRDSSAIEPGRFTTPETDARADPLRARRFHSARRRSGCAMQAPTSIERRVDEALAP